ncbi:MAG: L-threonylcarbamoyladenylate synthase [Oligoflexia bacterium]|nr:L-threonylcarbamoyladenylate synthase [Oligoflexia bacterium]
MILEPSSANIALAAEALRRGELVGMPTETVYGLAGAALDPTALARIFETKERPTFDPLIVHVERAARGLDKLAELRLIALETFSEQARKRAERLIAAFWPGPLTLVLPKSPSVPDLATSGLPSVGLRMPRHPVAQALLAAARMPLAAPSANRFGRISPTTARHVETELGDRIDFILDGGPCEIGLESTVLGVGADGTLTLLRPGAISRIELEQVAQAPVGSHAASHAGSAAAPAHAQTPAGLAAPGMTESHYAPSKTLLLLSNPAPLIDAAFLKSLPALRIGLLLMADASPEGHARLQSLARESGKEALNVRALSATGSLREIARNLFAGLRALDEGDSELLLCEPSPEGAHGLGHAIADRLRRASARRE